MKQLLFVFLAFCCARNGFRQTYFPMPSTDATWRYRFIVIDDNKDVTDFVLFVNGSDTVSGGNTYHKIFSRSCLQSVPISAATPPVTNVTATLSDIYYGAYREVDKKIYQLSASGEHLMYDFNAVVGSTIPGYSGLVTVTGIDVISLADGFHTLYKTTDTGFSVIEGVGSTRGLIPQLVSGTGLNRFMCFTHDPVSYTATMSFGVPCTSIAPLPAEGAVANVNNITGVNVYPIPANNVLHIAPTNSGNAEMAITNSIGQLIWHSTINGNVDIDVARWPKGIYIMRIGNEYGAVSQKIIIE